MCSRGGCTTEPTPKLVVQASRLHMPALMCARLESICPCEASWCSNAGMTNGLRAGIHIACRSLCTRARSLEELEALTMKVSGIIAVMLNMFALQACQSITPVGSYDPQKPIGSPSVCQGHNERCRERCSSEGVEESFCAVHPDGTVQKICECRGESEPPP
jgi:hypothetical protein